MEEHKTHKPTVLLKKQTGNINDYYKIGSVVATGSYYEVRICIQKTMKEEQREVKVIHKKQLDCDEKMIVFNEINITRELDHPNIVKMYEFFEDDKRYYIV